MKLLPEFLQCNDFVNADTIASGLSAFNPNSVSMEAGRLMLKRIHSLVDEKKDFAFETTLASRTFVPIIKDAKEKGYTFHLLFLWLNSPELAIERVRKRMSVGGHFVAEDIIRRRYESGRQNFNTLYCPLANTWIAFDNSEEFPLRIAELTSHGRTIIYLPQIWNQINKEYQ